MERHELLAWLGDDHSLTDEQVTDLLNAADTIANHYPGEDDSDEREAALTVAHRLMVEDQTVVIRELGAQLLAARVAERRALITLQHAVHATVGKGQTEAGFARTAGVDRMAVRAWLGKR